MNRRTHFRTEHSRLHPLSPVEKERLERMKRDEELSEAWKWKSIKERWGVNQETWEKEKIRGFKLLRLRRLRKKVWEEDDAFFGRFGRWNRWKGIYHTYTLRYILERFFGIKLREKSFLEKYASYGRLRLWLQSTRAYLKLKSRVIVRELLWIFRVPILITKEIVSLPFNLISDTFDLIKFLKVYIPTKTLQVVNSIRSLRSLPSQWPKLLPFIRYKFQDFFFDQNWLRNWLFKYRIGGILKTLFFVYVLLSVVDETILHTNNSFAFINEWWKLIYVEGLLWWLCFCLLYFPPVFLSLYFLNIYLYFNPQRWIFVLCGASFCDFCWPDILHESMFMYTQALPAILTYYPCCLWCFWINEQVEAEMWMNELYMRPTSWQEFYWRIHRQRAWREKDKKMHLYYRIKHRWYLLKVAGGFYHTLW